MAFRADAFYHIVHGMRIKTVRYSYRRHFYLLKTIRFLTFFTIEMDVLVRNGVGRFTAMAQFIFERPAAILDYVHDIFFSEQCKDPEDSLNSATL